MNCALFFSFSVGSKDDPSKGGLFALCTLDGECNTTKTSCFSTLLIGLSGLRCI